eukprot:2751031-Pleurochrysis_carterae.AAC.1
MHKSAWLWALQVAERHRENVADRKAALAARARHLNFVSGECAVQQPGAPIFERDSSTSKAVSAVNGIGN